MALTITGSVVLQVVLPGRFAPGHPLVPFLELVLLGGLFLADPGRIDQSGRWIRLGSLALVGVLIASNAWSAVKLVLAIISGAGDDAIALLSSGAAIWATNVVAFGLWYWEFDRGGPYERVWGPVRHPDFAFPQTLDPALARPGWSPRFVDYLYLSCTKATAFSPTDVMPLACWAELPADPDNHEGADARVDKGRANPPSYIAVHVGTETYTEYATNEREYHDTRSDPYQQNNTVATLPPSRVAELHQLAVALSQCHGPTSCWQAGHPT